MHEMHVHTHSQWSLPIAGWPTAVFTSTVNSHHGCDIWIEHIFIDGEGGGGPVLPTIMVRPNHFWPQTRIVIVQWLL